MEVALPDDCLIAIINYLDNADDHIHFSLISKIHLAIAENRRSVLMKRGPRSQYIKTFRPGSDALGKANLIKEINLEYRIADVCPETRWEVTASRYYDCEVVSGLLLHGSKIENSVTYEDLPLESKIPGIPDLASLANTLKDVIEQVTEHDFMLFGPVTSWPRFRLTSIVDEKSKLWTGEYTVTFCSIRHRKKSHVLLITNMQYRKPLTWETLSSDIRQVKDPKTNEPTIKDLADDLADDSIDPGEIGPLYSAYI